MVEAQTWTTRRMSNPRLLDASSSPAADLAVDIPATPPGDVRNGTSYTSYGGSLLTPALSTAAIIASWYLSNIGVLLLNKYLLSYYGYRYSIFLTMLHMIQQRIKLFTHSFLTLPPEIRIVQLKKTLNLGRVICHQLVEISRSQPECEKTCKELRRSLRKLKMI